MAQTKTTNSDDIVISVKNITKKFRVYFDKGSSLKERLLFKNRNRYEDRWVINGISFDVRKGEALGLIGQNGCGKSTTLKLLTRIMYPNSGTVEIKGRVSSLIELGAGFHPDMSGRENIYINASIFGLSKKEIDDRLQDIIDFSELHDYIDNPVRTYSSGMYTRLAFSVAVNVDADVLLIDEILAVGDASFQSKCFNKMMEIKAKGTTIVLVSHALSDVEKICDKAIWIKDGKISKSGVPRQVIPYYLDWIMSKDNNDELALITEQTEEVPVAINDVPAESPVQEINEIVTGNHDLEITNYQMFNADTGEESKKFSIGDNIRISFQYKRNNPEIKEAMASIMLMRNDGTICHATNSLIDTGTNFMLNDKGTIELSLTPVQLMQGQYIINISLLEDYGPVYYEINNAFSFEIYNIKSDYGVYRPNSSWRIE